MEAFRRVFRRWRYIVIAGAVCMLIFAIATWLPNSRLLWALWSDSSISLVDKVLFPLRLLQSITTNFTAVSASYTILIALIAGINASLAVYLMRTRVLTGGSVVAGLSGLFTGSLGVGCASCGSLILTSFIGTAVGIGILAFLPLGGSEFGIAGVVLLSISTYLLAKQITKPLACYSTRFHE